MSANAEATSRSAAQSTTTAGPQLIDSKARANAVHAGQGGAGQGGAAQGGKSNISWPQDLRAFATAHVGTHGGLIAPRQLRGKAWRSPVNRESHGPTKGPQSGQAGASEGRRPRGSRMGCTRGLVKWAMPNNLSNFGRNPFWGSPFFLGQYGFCPSTVGVSPSLRDQPDRSLEVYGPTAWGWPNGS